MRVWSNSMRVSSWISASRHLSLLNACTYLTRPTRGRYPVVPVAYLAAASDKKPHSATLLGIDLVIWRDANKQWHAFEDRCPHRCVIKGAHPGFQGCKGQRRDMLVWPASCKVQWQIGVS